MPHTRIIEKRQIHRTRPSMCPKGVWLSVMAVLWSINCSSSETKIANSRRRAFADDYVVFLFGGSDKYSSKLHLIS